MTESVEHCSATVTTEDKDVRIFKTPTQPVLPNLYYNSGGDKEYMPGCSLENIPFVGMIFDTLEDDVLKKAYVINDVVDDASKYGKKKQLVSDVWSKIFSCLVQNSKEVKDADIQVLVGSNEVDLNILHPNQRLNKVIIILGILKMFWKIKIKI
uniref:Uncharacterized protein n=1 Tax=Chenopodium quinoa TaxID=63459 RepID=A0A803MZC7_CHEQI